MLVSHDLEISVEGHCVFTCDLRDRETDKIECGKAHFAALSVMEQPAKYVVARNLADVI